MPEWRERPLDEFYPVVCLDAVRVRVRDNGRVPPKAARIAIGVDMDGFRHVLVIWVQDNEGASFWAHVCVEMANRGVGDALIVCCDGLKGLPEAVVCFCKLASTVWALFFSSTGGWFPAETAPSEPAAPFFLVIWS